MPANDFVLMQESAQRKASQDFLRKVVPDFTSAEFSGSSIVIVMPILQVKQWATHSPELNWIQFGTSCKNLCMSASSSACKLTRT